MKRIKDQYSDIQVIVGNVATGDATKALIDAGADEPRRRGDARARVGRLEHLPALLPVRAVRDDQPVPQQHLASEKQQSPRSGQRHLPN